MKRSKLSNELAWAFQYVDDQYLDLVEQEAAPRTMKFFWKQVGLVACTIGLILILALPIVAVAAKWFGLKDLQLPEKDSISLSGFQESAETQALSEWEKFLAEYDSDHKILNEIGNAETGFEEKYGQYMVYTQEMADKLEEIVQKYHLKLHTEMMVIDSDELENYVGGRFLGKNIDISMGYPYLYENGAFHFDGDAMYGNARSVGLQCVRTVKGTFDSVALTIGNIDDYQEFPYVASCGESVVLALSVSQSLIFADFDQCFVLLNILGGSVNGITEVVLQEIADGIDFTVLKDVKVPEMPGDSNSEWNQGAESLPAETDDDWLQSDENTDSEQPKTTIDKLDENELSEMKEKYKAILLDNGEFIHIVNVNTSLKKKLKLENIKEAVTDDDITVKATRFAMVDLDGNGDQEIVLWLQINGTSDYGYEILYYHDGEVYGFTLVYRQFLQPKTDGTFEVSGGAGDTSICRLQLYEEGYTMEEVFGSGHQDAKPDVEWYDLTEDNVEEQLGI